MSVNPKPIEFLSQGHDTTAAAANWAVHLIGEHPEVQERLQQEIEDVIGESGNNLGLRFDLAWLGARDLLGSRYLGAQAQHSPLVGHDSNHNNNNNDNNNDNGNDKSHNNRRRRRRR